MVDFIYTTSVDKEMKESFLSFIEIELLPESIPPSEELSSLIKAAAREKLKRLNIEKNMLTEKEITTDQILNNGEVSSIIRNETSLLFLREATEDATNAYKRTVMPAYLSYSWTRANLDDDHYVKQLLLNYINTALHFTLESYQLMFKHFTNKSGHGACVGIIPANINAPRKSNVKVVIIFSGFDTGEDQDVAIHPQDCSMDMHTALWRNIETYLEETVYHNEEVNKKTSKDRVDYVLGGYGLGGVFCQLTAIKIQDCCNSVVVTTLDTCPLLDKNVVTLPAVNKHKTLLLNLSNLIDVKIKTAKLHGLTLLGQEIPFKGTDNGAQIAHDYTWLGEEKVDLTNTRFADPHKRVYVEETQFCWTCAFF
eukprot:gene29317-36344_t